MKDDPTLLFAIPTSTAAFVASSNTTVSRFFTIRTVTTSVFKVQELSKKKLFFSNCSYLS